MAAFLEFECETCSRTIPSLQLVFEVTNRNLDDIG